MCITTGEYLQNVPEIPEGMNAIGAGPGIGNHPDYPAVLKSLFRAGKPLVLDADALNTIATHPELLKVIPAGTVITPHPKELDRLFGETKNDFERLHKAMEKSKEWQIHIVLKGYRTAVIDPAGHVSFNSTGNPGMAKPGSGDVLTGLLTGLLAQGYEPGQACLLGVYLHGLAGDIAAGIFTEQGMTAMDLAECISKAWKDILN
jgi:NAD(P)H-hydrate epimerase